MRKKTRVFLSFICSVLFLIIAPSVILYSQGYRIDFETKKISQTGGLFLKIFPKQVEIYLDSKLKKKTDWFFGSVLIENLIPKKYTVLIKKEGFHPWEKALEIKEKGVTEVKNIILFPQNLNFTIFMNEIEDFWFSPDQKKIVYKTSTSSEEKEEWSLTLYDFERNIKTHLIEEKDIHFKSADLLNLAFSPDSRKVLLEIGVAENLEKFSLEINKTPPVLTAEEETTPPLTNIVTYKIFGEEIYYLDNSGFLFGTDRNWDQKTKISQTPFQIKKETEYELDKFFNFVFLRENQIWYLLNQDSKSFENFFEPISGYKLSPDFEKLVYFSDYEIWVLFLKEKGGQPAKKVGEKLFLIRLSENIKDVFWLNSDYLIFNVEDKIKVSEIDKRDRLNVIDLAEFDNPKIFFNQNNKKLYVLSEGNLYESRLLLP